MRKRRGGRRRRRKPSCAAGRSGRKAAKGAPRKATRARGGCSGRAKVTLHLLPCPLRAKTAQAKFRLSPLFTAGGVAQRLREVNSGDRPPRRRPKSRIFDRFDRRAI